MSAVSSSAGPGAVAPPPGHAVEAEAARRRSFAIISHPDAGKTTLTEQLLVHTGAVQEAGSVRAKRHRSHTTSDFMELEQRRGISVSSTALRLEHDGLVLNLIDTPGHEDFSQDTFRALAAVDGVIMVLDATRGVEERTRQLFAACKVRGLPVITFANKSDRPGVEPLGVLDDIETQLGLEPVALTWPVGCHGNLQGVVDRTQDRFLALERVLGRPPTVDPRGLDALDAAADPDHARALEELDLLAAAGGELDPERVQDGAQTPVLFGAASIGFGVDELLDAVGRLSPAPRPRQDRTGALRPLDGPFTAQVFKVQANLDARHRDQLAFLRVVAGRFERGMRVTNARTGRPLALLHAHDVFARERRSLEEAFPGDVVGVSGAGDLVAGDTLAAGTPVQLEAIPAFAPQLLQRVRLRDVLRHKQFHRGLDQLEAEGVVHVMEEPHVGRQTPVLGAIGALQFEVAAERFAQEFGTRVGFEATPWNACRLTDEAGAALLDGRARATVLRDGRGRHWAAFASIHDLHRFAGQHPDVRLDELVGD